MGMHEAPTRYVGMLLMAEGDIPSFKESVAGYTIHFHTPRGQLSDMSGEVQAEAAMYTMACHAITASAAFQTAVCARESLLTAYNASVQPPHRGWLLQLTASCRLQLAVYRLTAVHSVAGHYRTTHTSLTSYFCATIQLDTI